MVWLLVLVPVAILLNSIVQLTALDNGLAVKPPMGWSTWNYYALLVNESLFYNAVKIMTENGMKDVGYEYLNVDAGWWQAVNKTMVRNSTGYVQYSHIEYPNGMKPMIDYIHSHGFKYGHYTDAGIESCNGDKNMSEYFKEQDISLFIEWGIDMIKIDSCNVEQNITQNIFEFGTLLNESLKINNKSILFSNCHNGCMNDHSKAKYGIRQWEPWCIDHFNMWRISDDIQPYWQRMLTNIDCLKYYGKHGQPGAWNDPDFLECGNGEYADNTTAMDKINNTKKYQIMINKNRAFFSLWCIVSAPLIAGNNLENMTDNILGVLTNKHAIAINQNYLNNAGDVVQAFDNVSEKLKQERYAAGNTSDVFYKPLPSNIGDAALLFLNRLDNGTSIDMSVDFIDLPLHKTHCDWFDIWDESTAAQVSAYSAMLPPQSVKFVRLYNCV